MNLNMEVNLQNMQEIILTWVLTHGLKIIFILIASFILIKLTNIFSKKIMRFNLKIVSTIEYEKKVQTLHSIVKSVVKSIIMLISGLLILQEIGINVGPILAAAGVVGLAVGFGSQRLVEDLISGFIILINDQIRVGDVIQIDDKGGYVEKVTLNMVVLRDLAGSVHFIRNGKIDVVTNMTKDFSYYVFDIGVAYKEDAERVIQVVKEIDENLRNDEAFSSDIIEPIEILGLDKFDDSAIIIKARTKTKPIKQWAVGREFNLRLKKKFDELGIEIPFPQRTIHMAK